MGDMEKHFLLMVGLMLLFFFMSIGADALVAFGVVNSRIGGEMPSQAFMAFFGIALGIFRGMKPDSGDK